MADERKGITRREMLSHGLRGLAALVAAGGLGALALGGTASAAETVWQIDPEKCTECGQCATMCVLTPSAVKCVHAYAQCGYCELCFGFFEDSPNSMDTAAENQRCPTGAIKRSFVEDPYYEYVIDEPLCIGCAKCVKGCRAFGNGSLFLQVRHDRCVNCNQCAIASACPSQAFVRVPADQPYLLKGGEPSG
ncbi:MAG: 4Fe-4S binding protein [Armatimonadota bacterium]